MSRSRSEHRDTCDCWQCVDSGDRPVASPEVLAMVKDIRNIKNRTEDLYDERDRLRTELSELKTWAEVARRELVANHMCPECMCLIEFVSHPAQGWACTDCPWTDDSLVWDNVYENNKPSCGCTPAEPCWKHDVRHGS